MIDDEDQVMMKKIIEENNRLIQENNELLKKIRRDAKIGLWIRIAWYSILIGLPFALYFYVLEPYFEVMGSSYETFLRGLNELPGLKGIENLLGHTLGD